MCDQIKSSINELLLPTYNFSEQWFSTSLDQFVQNLSDEFSNKAEKSNSVTVKSEYFTALHDIQKLSKQGIEIFLDSLAKKFYTQKSSLDTSNETSVSSLEKQKLHLIATNILEENLSFDTVIDKLQKRNKEAFEHLNLRIKELLKESNESLSTFPLSAENIISAFRHSMNSFRFSAEIRIITYQLFEKFILKHIPDFLKKINDRLIKQGLLPDFESDYSIKKNHNSRQTLHGKKNLETDNLLDNNQTSNNQTLNNIAHNIAISRLLSLTQGGSSNNKTFHNTPLIQNSTPLENLSSNGTLTQEKLEQKIQKSNQRIKQLLSQIKDDPLPAVELAYKNKQRDITNLANNTNQYNTNTIELIYTLNNIQHKLNINDGNNSSALSIQQQIRKQLILNNEQCSENTQLINKKLYLIDMIEDIFKHLSDNKNLSSTALYLLRSLTLPIIQLALTEHTFISNKNHPVRIFLYDYSNAAMALTENQSKTNNPLFEILKDIAHQIKNVKQINTAAFNTLHNKLKQFLSNQNQHIITEHFLSKISIEKEIDAIIKNCINGKQLPDSFVLVINNVWKNVMLDIFSNKHCDEDDKDKAIAFITSK